MAEGDDRDRLGDQDGRRDREPERGSVGPVRRIDRGHGSPPNRKRRAANRAASMISETSRLAHFAFS
jgi:hypothetical protein